METAILEDWPAVAALRGEWASLSEQSSSHGLFATFEWAECWWELLGDVVQPFVVTVRDAGRLTGLAPLYRTSLRLGGVFSFRTLRVLGDEHASGEYPDWPAAPDHERAACGAIARALSATREWDCLWLPRMADWTPGAERIVEACREAGLRCQERPRPFSAIDLPASPQAYLKGLSGNARSMLQRRVRQADQAGLVFVQCRSERERPEFLEALFALHQKRWTASGEPGLFARRPLEARFYERFTEVALQRGWLRLFGLRDGGRFVAIQIGYVYRGVFYQMQEGFDPGSPPGLGNVLRTRVIEQCIAEGVHTYDFLGGFTEHKRRWGARARTGRDVLVGRPTLRNALVFAPKLWPTGRYLRPLNTGGGVAMPAETSPD